MFGVWIDDVEEHAGWGSDHEEELLLKAEETKECASNYLALKRYLCIDSAPSRIVVRTPSEGWEDPEMDAPRA